VTKRTIFICTIIVVIINIFIVIFRQPPIILPSKIILNLQSLHLHNNMLVNSENQSTFLLGMSDSGLEYTCDITYQYQLLPEQFQRMRSWGINTVRLPLSAPYWLNANNSCPSYHATVDRVIHDAEAAGLYVVLSLAWIAPLSHGIIGSGGYPMADRTEALAFWQSVATLYAHDNETLFELYSEPHDITWSIWRDGGKIVTTDTRSNRVPGTYTAIGMQELVNYVSALAPDRLMLISGNEWGGDLTPVLTNDRLSGANIVYSVHLYSGPNSNNAQQWASRFGNLAKVAPVIASEFGQLNCHHDFLDQAMPYLASHTQGMMAWTWDIGDCGRPGILANYKGQTTAYGTIIHTFFQQLH